MKRTFFVAVLTLLLIALCLTAYAEETQPETFTSGDYDDILLDDGTAEIMKYNMEKKLISLFQARWMDIQSPQLGKKRFP